MYTMANDIFHMLTGGSFAVLAALRYRTRPFGYRHSDSCTWVPGVNSFKFFMAYKGVFMLRDDAMFAAFQAAASLGALVRVHAENGDVIAEVCLCPLCPLQLSDVPLNNEGATK